MSENTFKRTHAEDEWDAYWTVKNKHSSKLYDAIAVFYRRYIIKPALNFFITKTFKPGAALLHAGCGGGQTDTDVLRYAKVTALDISQRALDQYQALNGSYVQTLKGSIFNIPLPSNSVDGVYNLGVMEHFTAEEIQLVLKEFHRVLQVDGKILLFWPPAFGVSVMTLTAVHFVLNTMFRQQITLHPKEITRVRSRNHVRCLLEQSGFFMTDYYFGIRDAFTHAIVTAEKATAHI